MGPGSEPRRSIGTARTRLGRWRFSTRSLLIAVAIFGAEAAVVIEADKLGPGIEFTLFIGSVLLMLNLLYPGYLAAADRLNEGTPEEQTGQVLALGCFLVLIMIFLIPVVLVILLRSQV